MKLSALSSNPRIYTVIQSVFGWSKKPLLQYVSERITLGTTERVLDVGCGTGELGRLFSPGCYVGVDPSEEYIRFAQCTVPGASFQVMDATALTFPDDSFDRVLCTRVFHHLSDDEVRQTLFEMKRVVKPHGMIDIVDEVWPRRSNVIGNILFALDLGKHQRHFSQLSALLNSHGLTPVLPYVRGSFPVHYVTFTFQKN